MTKRSRGRIERVVGLDLSDRWAVVHEVDRESGEVIDQGRIRLTGEALAKRFGEGFRRRIALEVGTHSPWVSRWLREMEHEVVVANAREIRWIFKTSKKSDRIDAEKLARLARLDPEMLSPVAHRGAEAQRDLAVLRAREVAVRSRTAQIAHCRAVVKSWGGRLPRCSAEAFAQRAAEHVPAPLKPALGPILEQIAGLTATIRAYDRAIEGLIRSRYPAAERLQQVRGVGPVTSLSFVLTIGDPGRFRKSRDVGPYLGLVPRQDDSGDRRAQLRITKQGDEMVRRLLVSCGQYILGPFGEDCDLRRYGERITGGAAGNVKKRAVVAVARKLAVLLHRLWVSGEDYDPFYATKRRRQKESAAA